MQLAEDLKAAGAALWLDQLHIVGGELWDNPVQQARQAVRACCDYARGLRGLLRTLLAQPSSEQANPPPKRSLPIASEERRLEAEAQIKASHSLWSTTNAERSAHTNDISDISNDLNSVAFTPATRAWGGFPEQAKAGRNPSLFVFKNASGGLFGR